MIDIEMRSMEEVEIYLEKIACFGATLPKAIDFLNNVNIYYVFFLMLSQ